jgi:Putative prokaryotic signal transducing protein
VEYVDLVIVGAFGTAAQAEMAKSALAGSGIESMIQADSVGGMRPHVAWSSGGFKILVREQDAEAAREVLHVPFSVE